MYEQKVSKVWFSNDKKIKNESSNKFNMYFGLSANFEVFWFGLALGVFLKLISSPFLVVAPGYVNISLAGITDIQYRLVAAAGPAVNLILFLVAMVMLKNVKKMKRKEVAFWAFTKKLNLLLLIFNMIPFGPLDGAKVIFGLG